LVDYHAQVMMYPRSNMQKPATGMRLADIGWPIAVLASLLIVLLAAMTPWLALGPRMIVEHAFESLCHQQSDRSFAVGGIPFAVCQRCYGIYAGIALGLLIRPIGSRVCHVLRAHSAGILAAVLIPLCLDWGLDAIGILENTALTRVLTGFLVGSTGGLYLGAALLSEGSSPPNLKLQNATLR
jgi:uncharacterized membrane protein